MTKKTSELLTDDGDAGAGVDGAGCRVNCAARRGARHRHLSAACRRRRPSCPCFDAAYRTSAALCVACPSRSRRRACGECAAAARRGGERARRRRRSRGLRRRPRTGEPLRDQRRRRRRGALAPRAGAPAPCAHCNVRGALNPPPHPSRRRRCPSRPTSPSSCRRAPHPLQPRRDPSLRVLLTSDVADDVRPLRRSATKMSSSQSKLSRKSEPRPKRNQMPCGGERGAGERRARCGGGGGGGARGGRARQARARAGRNSPPQKTPTSSIVLSTASSCDSKRHCVEPSSSTSDHHTQPDHQPAGHVLDGPEVEGEEEHADDEDVDEAVANPCRTCRRRSPTL